MSKPWYIEQQEDAAKKVADELAKPDAMHKNDLGTNDIFDPRQLFPAVYGSYSSDFDDCAIDVLKEIDRGEKSREDLGAEMFREMLCVADLCEYGTSPRVCFPTQSFKALLPQLIRRWENYRKVQWGEA